MQLSRFLAPDALARRVTVIVLLSLSLAYPLYCDLPEGAGLLDRLLPVLQAGGATGMDPILMAVILLLGMWPVALANLQYLDERRNARWAFLAAFLFAQTGSVAPMLIHRLIFGPVQGRRAPAGGLARWIESRMHVLLFSFIWLVGLALLLSAKTWGDYLHLFRTDREVHLMTWNLFLWCACFGFLADEDLSRRSGGDARSPGMAAALRFPLLNVLVHLWFRPKFKDPSEVSA